MNSKQILQQDAFDILKQKLDASAPDSIFATDAQIAEYRQAKRALAARCASMSIKECRAILEKVTA